MNEEHVVLSENLEELRKAVEWGREQQKILKDQKCRINTAACAMKMLQEEMKEQADSNGLSIED